MAESLNPVFFSDKITTQMKTLIMNQLKMRNLIFLPQMRITLMSLLTKMMKLKVNQNQKIWMNKIVFEKEL